MNDENKSNCILKEKNPKHTAQEDIWLAVAHSFTHIHTFSHLYLRFCILLQRLVLLTSPSSIVYVAVQYEHVVPLCL